jgi:biopolymer transport protein TolQ
MTILSLLAAAQPSGHLNPVKLFLDADIVVQAVIAGLLIASVWVWTQIFATALRLSGVRKRCDAYEREFWNAGNFDAFQADRGKGDVPSARIAAAERARATAKVRASASRGR